MGLQQEILDAQLERAEDLATELTKLEDGQVPTWHANKTTTPGYVARLTLESDHHERLDLSYGDYVTNTSRLFVYADLGRSPDDDDLGRFVRHDEDFDRTISVSGTKTNAQIAKDIRRRMLAPLRKLRPVLMDRAYDYRESEKRRAALARDLAERAGGDIALDGRAQFYLPGGESYFGETTREYLTTIGGHVTVGYSEVDLTLRNLQPDEARELMDFLAPMLLRSRQRVASAQAAHDLAEERQAAEREALLAESEKNNED